MDRNPSQTSTPLERQLAHLKIISRLLGHELHSQTSARLTLSREEVSEIQISIDLFIESALGQRGTKGTVPADIEMVAARVN